MTQDVPNRLGNYRLVREIGRGGFATVYLAKHLHLKHYAAVKVLSGMSTEMEQFRKEAQTILDLSHPNIVRVFDFGIEPIPFLVMEYAPYGSLRLQYPRNTVVPLGAVLSSTRQIAAALQHAHRQHIIHRDVKPENMLLGAHQGVLLSDFGIALVGQSSRTRDVVGTTAYMAPEQILGKPRPASDQYALAVTVYEWLCGHAPFTGTAAEITAQHLSAQPPSLRTSAPKLSPDVEAVVLRALEKEPGQRYPTVLAFANALLCAAGGEQRLPKTHFVTEMATFRMRSEKSRRQPTAGARTTIQLQKPLSSRRQISRQAMLLGLLGIGGIGVGAFFLPKLLVPSAIPPFTTSTPTPNGTGIPSQTPSPTPGQTPTQKPAAGTLYASLEPDILTASWSPDGKYIATGTGSTNRDGNTVKIWNATNGNILFTCTGHTNYVGSIAWSPDGKYLVSGSADKTVRVWNATNGSNLFTCTGHTALVYSVVWSPDGKYLVSGSADKTVRVWDATNGNILFTYTQANFVKSVAWSPDSTRIVSTNVHEENIWNIGGTTPQLTYKSSNACNAVVWEPSGTRIASGEKAAVVIWDAASGNTLLTYTGHSDAVNAVAWSPDGRRLASASSDQTVRVWSAKDGSTLFTFQGHDLGVVSLAWSPDGSRIVSVGEGLALIWQAP